MKKQALKILVLLIILIGIPVVAYANFSNFKSSTIRPFGGRVIATRAQTSSWVVCAATYGALMVQPVNVATPGPYFIRTGLGAPRMGGWILGNYSVTPDSGTCYNTQSGVPIPAFSINPYGVSK